MKIYKYIAIVAVTLFFTSCERDDDTAVADQTSNIQVIVEPFGTTDTTEIIGQVGTNSVEMDFGFRLTDFSTTYFDSDVVITFEGNEYTISPEFDNNGDLIPESTMVVVGPTTVDFDIPAPTGSVPYNGLVSVARIDLSDTVYDFEVLNRPSNLVVLKGVGETVNINATVYGLLPPVTPGQINFLFDWSPNDSTGNNDLDLRIVDSGGGTADYSGTTSDFEDAFLSDTDADDTYEVRAEGWISSGSIAGIVFAMHPDGTLETFETDLTGIPNFGGQITMVIVEKVGGTYTLSQ